MNARVTTRDADHGLQMSPENSGLIPLDVVTLIPYPVARRLGVIATGATPTEVSVLMSEPDDASALAELEGLTGRRPVPSLLPAEEISFLLDRLAGTLETGDVWLQRRHIQSLSRLIDYALNLSQAESVRPLVDRALEFAPYSVELWLLKARIARQRKDVIQALTIASQVAPNDRRVLRWIDSLHDLDADEALFVGPTGTRRRVTDDRKIAGRLEPSMEVRSDDFRFVGPALEASRRIARSSTVDELLRVTADSLQAICDADSATVFIRPEQRWLGQTNHPALAPKLALAMPRDNGLAAQALERSLPMVVTDTSAQVDDVGRLMFEAGIRSFALLPVPGDALQGIAYINFNVLDRADIVLHERLRSAVDLVLTCAGITSAQLTSISRDPAASVLDELTGAYTPEYFETLVEAEIERARLYEFSVSMLSIDVDGFAAVNAGLGDRAGVELLRLLASRILGLQRASDILARVGADEFAVMLPQTTRRGAQEAAERIQRALANPGGAQASDAIPRELWGFTISAGWATFPDDAADAEGLMRAADQALLETKQQRT